MRTNATVSILSKEHLNGDISYSLFETVEVWLQHGTETRFNKHGKHEMFLGAGMFFLFKELNLRDKAVIVRGERFEIIDAEPFWDAKGNFHHMEVYYA